MKEGSNGEVMEEMNHQPAKQAATGSDLDRALDRALARFVSVDARPGLEERVLAHLHADQKMQERQAWGWSFAAALAVVVLLASAAAWKAASMKEPSIADRPPSRALILPPAREEAARRGVNSNSPDKNGPKRTFHARRVAVEALPKLDQFPAPRPLSEQEKTLAYYINADPERAALVAEARMDALRREIEERSQTASDPNSSSHNND
jgi:hypothetical protein